MFRLALFVGLVVSVAAQSSQCVTALTNIAGNNDANQCLALSTLIQAVKSNPSASIVGPVNTWLGNMCNATACSNTTIAAVVTNLTAGCSAEFNISSSDPNLIPNVQSLYPTIRKILCLKDGPNFCVTETLTNVETVTGPLTIANISAEPPTSLPSNVSCTDCNKASYNILVKEAPPIASTVQNALQTVCNSTFFDGSTPSGITGT